MQTPMSMIALLLEVSLRAGALILISSILARLLWRASAATLHWLWLLTLTAVLIFPIWLLLPDVQRATSASQSEGRQARQTYGPTRQYRLVAPTDIPAPTQANMQIGSGTSTAPYADSASTAIPTPAPPAATFPWPQAALSAWLFGLLVMLGRYAWEQIAVVRLVRRGMALVDPDWCQTVEAICAALDLRRPVRITASEAVRVPMAWGVWRPIILLPGDALGWSAERRRAILTHELVHIRRGDTLTQWIGLLCCAIQWFNPPVWWAVRRLSVECERACDDRVLLLGTSHSDYAAHLVAMARAALKVPKSITALSRGSALSLRVRSILQPGRNRRPLSPTRRLGALLSYTLLCVFPLSALQPLPALSGLSSQATEDTTLVLGIPAYLASMFTPYMLDEFEAAHPGWHVMLNPVDEVVAARYTDEYYAQLERYASAGDVLFVHPPQFGPAATLPDYFLDLTPLTSTDTSLNVDDFYPAAWRSFQWDGKQWGVPLYWSLDVFSYDPAAFDAVGLAYPKESWTAADLINAARLLKSAEHHSLGINGGFNPLMPLLLTSLPGISIADTTVQPPTPRFDDPALAAEIERWAAFVQEDAIGPRLSPEGSIEAAWDTEAPMQIAPLTTLTPGDGRAITTLPGGHAVIGDIGGLAISAGAQHPEAAFELLKFLSNRPESISLYGSAVAPARRSVFQTAANNLMPELKPIFAEFAEHALPLYEPPFQDYLSMAVGLTIQGNSATEALAEAAIRALADQQLALARRGTFTLLLPTPVAVEMPPGETALRFGLFAPIQPLPNGERWEQVMADFAEDDPEVGYVDLTLSLDPRDMAAHTDCFYTPFAHDLTQRDDLLDLQPLIAADPDFDPADFLPGVLDQMRRGDTVVGYPISVQPQVLAYRADLFQQWSIPLPENGWTMSAFVASLEAIKSASGDTPMATTFGVPEHLLLFVEAFGGLPIDSRVFPPVANFTSRDTVEAIQRALDLVRHGYINYMPLNDPESAGGTPGDPALKTAFLDPFSWMGLWGDPRWSYVTYPEGERVRPVSIGVGAVYISRSAVNPEACYRWIKQIEANPDLIMAMPSRTSAIDDPRIRSAQGDSLVSVYQTLDSLMRSPGTLVTGTVFGGDVVEVGYLKYWLYHAFEAHLLQDMPLEDALADAQIKAEAYLVCAARLPTDANYYDAQHACAQRADPEYP